MTDELRRDCLGCYGNPIVKTPNLDKLAREGIRFDAAYTPSPICVPARASIATGRYVHEIGCWGNAMPYSGMPESWHHKFRADGRRVASIGKLHFRSSNDDNGFTEEIRPVHVKDGKGWVHGLLREELDLFDASGFATNIGPGDDSYSQYDRDVCAETVSWLKERSGDPSDTPPWGLYVSFLRPHYPLTCPSEFYELYDPDEVPLPRKAEPKSGADHPILQGMREACDYDEPFDDETRRIAVASYYGLCSFVDDLVGKILGTLAETGYDKTTTVIFTSDHGECLGDRGFWTKMVMFEEATAVPLMMAGPHIASGVSNSPVSLIDLFPTVLELGAVSTEGPTDTPNAKSLLSAIDERSYDRPILSEYHDYGAQTGMFMLRCGPWKLVVYPGYPSQLYDLESDPEESHNLATDARYAGRVIELQDVLNTICNPDEINANAFADQKKRIAELGGKDAILAMENFDHTPVG